MALEGQRGLLLFLCLSTLAGVFCYNWYFVPDTETPIGETRMLQNASLVQTLSQLLRQYASAGILKAYNLTTSLPENLKVVHTIKHEQEKKPTERLKTQLSKQQNAESNEQVNKKPNERLKQQPIELLNKKPTEKLKEQPPKQSNEQLTKEPNEQLTDGPWKTILFWNTWFGGDWSNRWGTTNSTELRLLNCPSWRCHFTYNRSLSSTADAIVYQAGGFGPNQLPPPPRPYYQRFVWVNVEAQSNQITRSRVNGLNIHNLNPLINYTMVPHQESDVYGFYGYFLSLGAKQRPVRPNLMSSHGEAMAKYLKAYDEGATLKDVMGAEWSTFVRRPHPVAWMSSHCPTPSRREEYVKELQKYIDVGTYGRCGNRTCYPRGPLNSECWTNEISHNYSFYLAMENSLCQDYITEKLYNPIVYNLVPIVWGGSDYSLYLPPHSYINARDYHPKDLARLLLRLHQDPVAYGRYHLWRGYLGVHVRGSLCELCHLLHTDQRHHSHTNIGRWISETSHCTTLTKPLFTNPNYPDMWKTVINKTNSKL